MTSPNLPSTSAPPVPAVAEAGPRALKAMLREPSGAASFGLFCSTPAPLTVELIAAAGFDFVIVDLEHTLIDGATLAAMLLAARAAGIAALVRPAAPWQIAPVLDQGAQGIVVPRVQSADEARQAVRAARHAPLGQRGLNATAASRFGRDDLAAAAARADADTLVIAMIEDRTGLAAADAIAAVDGIDALLGGAADLSQDLGLTWRTRAPEVREALARIDASARATGKQAVALPRDDAEIEAARRAGARLVIAGDDRGIARRAFAAACDHHHRIFNPSQP